MGLIADRNNNRLSKMKHKKEKTKTKKMNRTSINGQKT